MQLSPKRAVVVLSLDLCCLVSTACSNLLKKPPSDEEVAVKARVISCEWKAANQYDDNRYKTFYELVHQVMDVCAAERSEVRSASDRASDDKRIDKDEFNEAVEVIKNARDLRKGTTSSQQENKNKDKDKSKSKKTTPGYQ
jgi:hypothetical protein